MKVIKGVFEPTVISELEAIFPKYVAGKNLLDLGSGVGTILVYANQYAASAKGVEYEMSFIRCTQERIKVEHEDMFDISFAPYDCLYYYISGSDNDPAVIAKIKAEFKGTIIFYHTTIEVSTPEELANPDIPPKEADAFYELCKGMKLVEEWRHGKVYIL